jgi:hypothetical protein
MQTLFPPEYPEQPDSPLLGFGPAFSEEISRSVISAVWQENDARPHETEVRIAASLTMLEAFHPRDHLECMMAAQGVACHAMIMECYGRAMRASTPEAVAIKLRSNVTQLSRTFSVLLHDMERRQGKPLLPRPLAPPPQPAPAPKGSPPMDRQPEEPDLPEDIVTRPDGTPGSLAAYAPKPPEVTFIPKEPAIMVALATRPKPWRMVNAPPDQRPEEAKAEPAVLSPGNFATRGPLDPREKIFTGDALARFTSARFDPDAPVEPMSFEHEDATFELELISTGGDPEAEAEREAMMAAHPEGKPVVTFRYGTRKPADKPPRDD